MTKKPAAPKPLDVAFSLARHGFHVFPVSARKVPLVKLWQSEASTDPEVLATWWLVDFPDALVGYAAGLSDVVIVDLDADKGNGSGVDNLKTGAHDLPQTLHYSTPSGGAHYVYRAPKGNPLTIAQNHPVAAVDIRAGNGFAIYYGQRLTSAPALAAAPSWALVEARDPADARAPGASVSAWLSRATGGKPSATVKAAAARIAEHDTDHAVMLEAVGQIVALGTQGQRGAGVALAKARKRYSLHYPDYARAFDNAAEGSVKHVGLPPVTIPLSKAERKAVAARAHVSAPQAIRERAALAAVGEDGTIFDDLTDAALAEQVAAEAEGLFAVAKGLGLVKYDAGRWSPVDELALIEAVRKIMRRIRATETRAAIMRGDKRRESDARALEQRTRIVAVARLALGILSGEAAMPDAYPELLNTPTGVVDLRTGKLKPHDPRLLLTKMTTAEYNPDADRSMWLRALEAVPPKVADWLQVRLGQAATGYTPEDDVMPIFMGSGDNGKTTVLHAPRQALGDYAVTVPDRLFMANPGDHPTELTTLMGARFAVAEELAEGRNLNVKRVKDTLGTPTITARRMRSDNVTWLATHSLMLTTNYTPIVNETDHGTWRRLCLVVFPFKYVRQEKLDALKTEGRLTSRYRLRDPSVKRALDTADPGVLAWMVEGAKRWFDAGAIMPPMPKRVAADTLAWRHEADPVLSYADERLVVGRDAAGWAVAAADLASDFNAYIEARGHRAWSLQTINARFTGHEALRDAVRRRVAFGPKHTPSRPSSFMMKPLSANTNAWLGVKFASEDPRLVSEAERDADVAKSLERRLKD
jgi:putative DNA primase/helicase